MLILTEGNHQGLSIAPRWPSSRVMVDNQAFAQLLEAQSRLSCSVQLLVTRGYEYKSSYLGSFRSLSRWLGIRLFCWCYPQRKQELEDIFGSNGHDVDGTHVDVSIVLDASACVSCLWASSPRRRARTGARRVTRRWLMKSRKP